MRSVGDIAIYIISVKHITKIADSNGVENKNKEKERFIVIYFLFYNGDCFAITDKFLLSQERQGKYKK